MPILNQPVQQFSPWHGSLVRKSSVKSRERDSVLLGHCRQGPNHDPSFWDVDSGCVPARILQQPFQLISQAAWSPIQAGPRIVLQDSEQFRLHARGVASQPFAQGEPQPTVGVKRVCRKPLQKIATGKPEITPVQRIPALLRRRWQRRWQCDVLHVWRTPVPGGRPPFHTVGSIPPRPPSQGVATGSTPAQKSPAKGMTA